MSAADWGVVVAGITLIALINWYFFFSEGEGATAAVAAGGLAEVAIVVRDGYTPSTVRVPRGARLRLVFDRQEDSSCSEEVVIPDFGVRRFLPAHEKTPVELAPPAAGSYEFMCGMGMLRGTIVVEDRS